MTVPAQTIPFSSERLVARPADPDAMRRAGDGLGVWALARRDDAGVVGQLELTRPAGRRAVAVGWHVLRRWRGSGYASEAVRAALRYAIDVLGSDEVAATVPPDDDRARAVALGAGMAPAGRVRDGGTTLDVYRLTAPVVDARHVRVAPVSPEDVVGLRQRVLRPHVPPSALLADDDVDAVDLAALASDGSVVGCARLCHQVPSWRSDETRAWRLRNMATSAHARGLGIGVRLVDEVRRRAVAAGATLVWCAARTSAEGFYARCGFVRATEPWHDPELGWHVGMMCRLGHAEPGSTTGG